ncbi:SGNH/GDSL hydrolase family protein [Streptomyces sp. A7024]|uniref:SGNH/GDSL hydrolase family protein n=1 Tax=Streptomyces coryli TaxID=1128680 RepID=A0A6G4U2U6_9ACTN|nr:SGNH/GDSL hydrolase family protein [Streptomyces coryli]NGN66484.1 SGNH/GDSL hydrolase family protein [Streptomyces coryli]
MAHRASRAHRASSLLSTATLVALAATALPATATAAEQTDPVPLDRLYDNTAISDDARPQAADFDGAGASLSAQDLSAAGWRPGTRLNLDAAQLALPASRPGTPDNVRADGQAVKLHGRGNALSFLVAATSPGAAGQGAKGTGTIRYRDGSTSSYDLSAPDWRGGPHSTKAISLPHLNTPGGQQAERPKLYAVTVPVKRGAAVDSVVLPEDPGPDADLHVFAASVRAEASAWTGSWGSSTSGYTAVGPWTDQTLRLVVHSSAGGNYARIRLSNTFAGTPLRVGGATVAVQGEGAKPAGKPVRLTFGGRSGTEIAAGAQAVSDPVGFRVPAGSNLLVSFHLPERVEAAPVHSLAMQTSYISAAGSGNRTGDTDAGAFGGTITTWPFLTGVDVGGGPGSVVTLGDSITDGQGSTKDANRRWPDFLAGRLRAASQDGAVPAYGVLNQGISANRVVGDRYTGDGVSTDVGGVSAQNRLERDVLAQTNARTVFVFEGVNDARWSFSPDEIIAGLTRIADRAHARGLRVVVATVVPCEGEKLCSTAQAEATRTKVNDFIRAQDGGTFDAVADFDAVVRDPAQPSRLQAQYDSSDHLHLNDAGLKAMADSLDLRKLMP